MYEIYDVAFQYNKNVKYYGYEEGNSKEICDNEIITWIPCADDNGRGLQ